MNCCQLPEEFRIEILSTVNAQIINQSSGLINSEEISNDNEKTSPSHWLNTDFYIFLEKFGSLLSNQQLELIVNSKIDNEERWLAEYLLKKRNNPLNLPSIPHNKSLSYIKNRRLTYLNQVLELEGYFSSASIQQRNPALFAEYCENQGKDAFSSFDPSVSLVERIYYNIDMEKAHEFALSQKDHEDDAWEEEEEEDEEDSDDDKEDKKIQDDDTVPNSTACGLFPELVKIMKERFLDGLDKDFDYSVVDNNEEYDNPILVNQKMEESYFDSEDPTETTDTGILDY